VSSTARPQGGFTEDEWNAAVPWKEYFESIVEKRDLWDTHWNRAFVGGDAAERLVALPGRRRVLVLTEDWCGDACRSVPVLAKAFAQAPLVEARYLASDDHPQVILRYLSHGGRAIPMAIVQDEAGREIGAWGPRPAPLQALYRERRRVFGAPTQQTMGELYAPVMKWYGDDGGKTILAEILVLLERGGTPR
jgi:thioredoxin family protein